jgi:DnaJ family protein C protein 27
MCACRSPAVGKSCLIKRYCESKFVTRYISTIGVDFGVRGVTIDGKVAKVHFWDLSGNPSFAAVRNEFYGSAQGLMLVYDVTSRASFDDLTKWLREARTYGLDAHPETGECKAMVICANKADLGKKRVVSESDGRAFARANNMLYYETSAKTGKNVNEVFTEVFESISRTLHKPIQL